MKRLSVSDVSVQFKDSDFKVSGSSKNSLHPGYFVFQDEALRQIRLALDNPRFYRHFLIIGDEGTGKRSSISSLLKKEYSKKLTNGRNYYSPFSNSIVKEKTEEEGLIPLFDPEAKETPVVYDPAPNTMSLVGIPSKSNYHPGNLIKASGGFLILPITRLVSDPIVYDVLKSCLLNEKIDFINLPELNFFSEMNRTLPKLPIDVRVILIGDDHSFEQLLKKDTNLGDIFKMKVDMEYEAEVDKKNIARFSALIDSLNFPGYPESGVDAKKRLLEQSLRLNESKSKFTLNITAIKTIYKEALVLAKAKNGTGKKVTISSDDIQAAIDNIDSRDEMPKRKYYEALKHGMYNILLTGKRLGRINGLSIYTPFTSNREYGQVNVISSRALMGSGNFINIEREVNLSGDVHDKGVFILQSYLKGLFSGFNSFGVDISILFEQNHSMVDGDSATVAELIATLSALSDYEIPCNIAITGSMSQYGEILPVGAINEKIEAWFGITRLLGNKKEDYCVYIPSANSKDLILSTELRKAIKENKFHIYPFSHVTEVVPHILKITMGKMEKDGKYTKDSILRRIEDRLDKKKEIEKDP